MRTTAVCLALALLAAPAFAQIQSNAKDGIDVAMDAFLDGVNNHDPRAIAASFVKDGDLIDSRGAVAKGREDIEKFFAKRQSPLSVTSTVSFRITGRKKLGAGAVLVDADGTLSGVTTPDGATLPDMQHHLVIVFVRKGVEWKIQSLRAYAYSPMPAVQTSPEVPGTSAPASQ